MPKIPRAAINSVVFLYKTEEDAKKGRSAGGTGFLVVVPSEVDSTKGVVYAVTNRHVACMGEPKGASVVRVNKKDGGIDIFPFDEVDWQFSPELQADIVVAHLPLDGKIHQQSAIPTTMFITREDIENAQIGPGDDVFMVGRFMNHDGKKRNNPAVRFGNISTDVTTVSGDQLPPQRAFCIDLHSRSGYSGSPVFVYRTPGYDLEEKPTETLSLESKVLLGGVNFFKFLGIHFAQFPEKWEVKPDGKLRYENSKEPLIKGNHYIEGVSGMTCVIPAWEVMETLNMPKLKEGRESADAALREEVGGDVESPKLESTPDNEEGDELLRRMLNTPPKPRR